MEHSPSFPPASLPAALAPATQWPRGLKLGTMCSMYTCPVFCICALISCRYSVQFARGTPQDTKEAILCPYHKLWLVEDSGMLAHARSSEGLRFIRRLLRRSKVLNRNVNRVIPAVRWETVCCWFFVPQFNLNSAVPITGSDLACHR